MAGMFSGVFAESSQTEVRQSIIAGKQFSNEFCIYYFEGTKNMKTKRFTNILTHVDTDTNTESDK